MSFHLSRIVLTGAGYKKCEKILIFIVLHKAGSLILCIITIIIA